MMNRPGNWLLEEISPWRDSRLFSLSAPTLHVRSCECVLQICVRDEASVPKDTGLEAPEPIEFGSSDRVCPVDSPSPGEAP